MRTDRYHLKDVIVGKIYFLLVRIKVSTDLAPHSLPPTVLLSHCPPYPSCLVLWHTPESTRLAL